MQKGSAQLLIVIVVLLFVGSGIYLFQTNKNIPPQTAPYNNYNHYDNYKISFPKENSPTVYSNETLGFQFEYGGNNFSVKEDTEEGFNKRGNGNFRKNFASYVQYEPGKFLGAVVVLDKEGNFDTNSFTIWVFDNPNDLDIDTWYKNYWYYPFVWGDFTYKGKFELAPKEDATISGQMGQSGIIDYAAGKPKFIYLAKDKKMYLFRIIGESGDKILATFKFSNQEKAADCKVTGCSGQICADEDVITTCEWIEAYACYNKDAKCERQADGECGWTKTEELTKCLNEKKNASSDTLQ